MPTNVPASSRAPRERSGNDLKMFLGHCSNNVEHPSMLEVHCSNRLFDCDVWGLFHHRARQRESWQKKWKWKFSRTIRVQCGNRPKRCFESERACLPRCLVSFRSRRIFNCRMPVKRCHGSAHYRTIVYTQLPTTMAIICSEREREREREREMKNKILEEADDE